jgi:hypothetical protein
MASAMPLFASIPRHDHLGFYSGQGLETRKVAEFLDLKKPEVARLAGVSTRSIRYDDRIPKEALEYLEQIATIAGLVAGIFEGDVQKTSLWFRTPNPLLGQISPRDMIRYGRYDRLLRFVHDAIQDNSASAGSDGQTTAA